MNYQKPDGDFQQRLPLRNGRLCRRWIIVTVLAFAAGCASEPQGNHRHQHERPAGTPAVAPGHALVVPAVIHTEHEHLHHQLEAAIASGGKTGARAKDVAAVLHPHFQEEEAYAMPPLGLLEPLARNQTPSDAQAREAIEMSERLRREYDKMLNEHRSITDALRKLASAAHEEGKATHAAFAEALIAHAQNEEQILYPATLLIGDYLKLRLAQAHSTTRHPAR